MGDRFNYMELPEPDFSARANSTTVERGATTYSRSATTGASAHSTMSCGEGREVSIQRRQACCGLLPAEGSSKSKASQ